MPHLRQAPGDIPSILATATPDPEWVAALEDSPIPAGTDYGTDPVEAMSLLKQMAKATYPRQRALLNASRPLDVTELEVHACIPATDLVPTAAKNSIILCHPISSQTAKKWPLIVLIHGGGHSLGSPLMELPLARLLVQQYGALVVLPSYRLAPEHPFPASFNDCFETLKQLATEIATQSASSNANTGLTDHPIHRLLPTSLTSQIEISSGFVLGGTSAGCTIAASISHLYHVHYSASVNNFPPLTGLFLSCGSSINSQRVPSPYKPFYLSHEQNTTCVPLDSDLYKMFSTALKPSFDTPLMASLDQHPERFRDRATPAEDHGWVRDGAVRVYFQACGMDMNRDDMLIYERMLRDEVGVETRLDLYAGFGHCFWGMSGVYAEMDMTRRRTRHTVEGIGWLLKLKVME